jgi:hypothetical protein
MVHSVVGFRGLTYDFLRNAVMHAMDCCATSAEIWWTSQEDVIS